VLARRLFDDDSFRPLGGVVRVFVSAAEYKPSQTLTNDASTGRHESFADEIAAVPTIFGLCHAGLDIVLSSQ